MVDRNFSLRDFFDALERRLARKVSEWYGYKLAVCGRIIELRFATPEAAGNAFGALRKFIVATQKASDAIFVYWVDDCAGYIGEDHRSGRWEIRDDFGCLSYLEHQRLVGSDEENHVLYFCCQGNSPDDPIPFDHPLCTAFFQWARSENLLMLHAAAVGASGKGLLIAGRGGAGKSTLSVSCLLSGMDFVADDYMMLTGSGPCVAMPIYSSICLHPDMREMLKPDMPVLGEWKNHKLTLDASAYPFAAGLNVRGLLQPTVTDAKEPEICAIPAGALIVRVAHSTVKRFSAIPSPELIGAIASRLMELPAYELRQCGDYRKNAEYLRKFIEEMI